jgi:hypothetical protein
MTRVMRFPCPVVECDEGTHPIQHVMCSECWKMVPQEMKSRIHRTWSARKRFGDARSVAEHEAAKTTAIGYVGKRRRQRRQAA